MSDAIEPLDPEFRQAVRERLRQALMEARLDAALILKPGNVRYLTGWDFRLNERPMGITPARAPPCRTGRLRENVPCRARR